MSQLEPLIRLAFFWGCLFMMAGLEWRFPRRPWSQDKRRRWLANIGLAVFNVLLVRLTLGAALYLTAIYVAKNQWGLLHLWPLPPGLSLLLGIVLLDFAIYAQHVLFHAIPLFWRLHRIHHSDLDFDVTTAIRFHPLEILASLFYKMSVVAALGIPPTAVLVYEVMLNILPMFHHTNISLPPALERVARWLIITPDMHRIHHSSRRPETNSNFGVATPLWDRLCGTYVPEPEKGQAGMEIGLEQYRQPDQVGFWQMLLMPFRKLT